MSKVLTPPLPLLCKHMHLWIPFNFTTGFVLFSEMKQITNGPTTTFTEGLRQPSV